MARQIAFGVSPPSQAELEERISELEAKVAVLAEAITALVQGLSSPPTAGAAPEGAEQGARLAHELLIAARLTGGTNAGP